jgi:prevent-host-death family protein
VKTIGLFEAKTKFSELCSQVAEEGAPVLITRRGQPLVRIEPVVSESMGIRERLEAYRVRHGHAEKPAEKDFEPAPRSKEWPKDPDIG